MKVISSKPKNQRMFKSILFKHNRTNVRRPFCIEPVGGSWWFDLSDGQWTTDYNGVGGMTTSYYSMKSEGFKDVYSLKAVKRLIHKWDVPKGTKFRASLPFVGHDFYIKKS